MFSLSGRSVVVTGGSKGIGRGIASVFAEAGANVAVAARSATDIDSAVTELERLGDGEVIGVSTDVVDPASCAAMAKTVVDAFGGIDVLCANAGIFPEAPLATMTPEQLAEVLDVNVKGNVFSVQACLPALIESGHGRVILDVVDHGAHHRISQLVSLRRLQGGPARIHADRRNRAGAAWDNGQRHPAGQHPHRRPRRHGRGLSRGHGAGDPGGRARQAR